MTPPARLESSNDMPVAAIEEDYAMERFESFDEFTCEEKIDLKGLQRVVDDLSIDSFARAQMVADLRHCRVDVDVASCNQWIGTLHSCDELQMAARRLYNALKDYPTDENGCLVYKVKYKQASWSGQRRLYAVGSSLRTEMHSNLPSLQTMPIGLRAPLVGSFAHDIGCENSQVRVLCSLSLQYNLSHLVPALFDYRDNQNDWIDLVASLHNVTKKGAKTLVTIVISGGGYNALLESVDIAGLRRQVPVFSRLQTFAIDLSSQIRILAEQLLKKHRFHWILGDDNDRLEQQVSRIIHSCETEVLHLLHRSFHMAGWTVRAKMFDCLIVEPGGAMAVPNLKEIMRIAEERCRSFSRWDLKLVERPLRGRENDPITAVVDARAALQAAQEASCRPYRCTVEYQ